MSSPITTTKAFSSFIHTPNNFPLFKLTPLNHHIPFPNKPRHSVRLECAGPVDEGMALSTSQDLSSQILHRIKTQLEEQEKAMKKSKELLFFELCEYLDSDPNEFRAKWVGFNPDEKMGLVNGFVCNWGLCFHPLSVKSVRDLVDEFVLEDMVENSSNCLDHPSLNLDGSGLDSGHSDLFFLPRLKNMLMGLSHDK